jgi:hypothetical protein
VGGYAPYEHLPSTSPEENEELDTDPPAAPELASAVLAGGSNEDVVITWTLSADDGAGDSDVLHYAVYVSDSYDYEGDGYSFLGQAGSGESSFTHALAGDGDWTDHFYYVQANDTSGNGNWTGQAGLVQEDTTLEVVLQTLAGSFKHVRYYKSSDQSDHWKTYWTFKTYRTLFDIDHKMGFWIDMTKDDHLVVAGLVPEMTQIELGHNWNLVGYPSFIDRTVSEALAGIDWKKVQGWGNTQPYHQKQMSGSDIMTAGEGYWIWVDLPQVWEVYNKPADPPYIVWTDPLHMGLDIPLYSPITVKFSKEMDTSSLSWSLIPQAPGTLWYEYWYENDTLLVIESPTPLAEGVQYEMHILSARDKSGAMLVPGPAPNPWTFITVIIPPTIVATYPANMQLGVSPDTYILVNFSESMNESSLIWSVSPDPGGWTLTWYDTLLAMEHSNPFLAGNVTVEISYAEDLQGLPLAPGPVDAPIIIQFSESMNVSTFLWAVFPDPGGWSEQWTNGNTTVTLTHANPFSYSMIEVLVDYVEDIYGRPLVPGPVPNPFVFTTISTVPYIVMTDPYDGEIDVDVWRNITVWFSEPINTSTFGWSLAPDPGGWYQEEWSANDTVVVLKHVTPFTECTMYSVTVTSADDKQGNPLVPGPVPNPWSFKIESLCPYVLYTVPTHNETNVSLTQDIIIMFSAAMNASTLSWSMTTGPDPGGWTEVWPSPDFLVLSHANPFTPSTTYIFELTYIEGENGYPLCGLPIVIEFTTTS